MYFFFSFFRPVIALLYIYLPLDANADVKW